MLWLTLFYAVLSYFQRNFELFYASLHYVVAPYLSFWIHHYLLKVGGGLCPPTHTPPGVRAFGTNTFSNPEERPGGAGICKKAMGPPP